MVQHSLNDAIATEFLNSQFFKLFMREAFYDSVLKYLDLHWNDIGLALNMVLALYYSLSFQGFYSLGGALDVLPPNLVKN